MPAGVAISGRAEFGWLRVVVLAGGPNFDRFWAAADAARAERKGTRARASAAQSLSVWTEPELPGLGKRRDGWAALVAGNAYMKN
eukprot:2710737-Lingulodinium_polyedra.AAC.1